eukprot:9731400-Alexandrium_andersonii.AAC.1
MGADSGFKLAPNLERDGHASTTGPAKWPSLPLGAGRRSWSPPQAPAHPQAPQCGLATGEGPIF